MQTTQTCVNCNLVHTFTVRKQKKYSIGFYCSKCRKEEQKAIRHAHPDVMKARDLMKSFKLTPEQYAEILASQYGVCAICKRPEFRYRNGKAESLGVDPNHTTGKIRGLLCHTCNSALGLLQDSPELLITAAQYLKSFE